MFVTLLFCVLAYSIGSISSAVVVCRLYGLPDPRTIGSKNPGATNVLRMGNKKLALFTLLGDILKGVVAVSLVLAYSTLPEQVGPVIIAVFLGHLYPIFFKFQGGKGVATAIGAIFVLSWPVGLLLVITWIIVVLIFQMVSLASLVAAFLAPFYVFFLKGANFSPYIVVISMLLFWRHRSNIERIIQGKEPKIKLPFRYFS